MKKIPDKVIYSLLGSLCTFLIIGCAYGIWLIVDQNTGERVVDNSNQEISQNEEESNDDVEVVESDENKDTTTEESEDITGENTDDGEEEKEYWSYMGTQVEVELRKFVVEYRKGDGGYVTFEAKMPVDAEITLGGSTSAWTKITFMNSEFTLSVPHMGFSVPFSYPQSIENDNIDGLYRVVKTDDTSLKYYVTDLVLSGVCQDVPEETYSAPCGPNSVRVADNKGVTISYAGLDEKVSSLADKVMESLRVVE